MGLLIMIGYVFGIAMVQLSDGFDFREAYFSSVPLAIYTLFVYGTFGDNLAEFMDNLRAESTPCLMLATLYVVLSQMTVLNMLIGVLCQVIQSMADEERENLTCDKVHEMFGHIVSNMDTNKN